MLLVPRQLKRSGMTGTVPYYGGRMTPAQAWAAAHPTQTPPAVLTSATPGMGVHTPLPGPTGGSASRDESVRSSNRAALQHLRDSGVLSAAEYDQLLKRTT